MQKTGKQTGSSQAGGRVSIPGAARNKSGRQAARAIAERESRRTVYNRANLKKRLEKGQRVTPRLPDSEQLKISRTTMQSELESFDESYKRILNPHIYKVSLTEKLMELKKDFIEKNIR